MSNIVQLEPDFEKIAVMVPQIFDGDALKVMPTAFYRQFDRDTLSMMCVMSGLYCLPTFELLDVLNELILEVSPSRNVIEVGAGNGALGRGLGITMTDNYVQTRPDVIKALEKAQHSPVWYGPDVLQMDGNAAVDHYKPEVVIGAWVSHRHDPNRPELGGNIQGEGLDEEAILSKVKRYIVIGNKNQHGNKPIMPRVTKVLQGDYLVSRSHRFQAENAIFVWDNPARAGEA